MKRAMQRTLPELDVVGDAPGSGVVLVATPAATEDEAREASVAPHLQQVAAPSASDP